MTFREMLELVAISAGVWTTLTAAAWWLIKPRFQRAVLLALQENPGEYRRWNDSLYADWRKEQVDSESLSERTHVAVQQLQSALSDHRAELQEHRERMERAIADLSHLPRSLESLARAIERSNEVNAQMQRDLHATQLDVARIMAKP